MVVLTVVWYWVEVNLEVRSDRVLGKLVDICRAKVKKLSAPAQEGETPGAVP